MAASVVDSVYGHAPRTTMRDTKDFKAFSVCCGVGGGRGERGGRVDGVEGEVFINITEPSGVVRGVVARVTRRSSGRWSIKRVCDCRDLKSVVRASMAEEGSCSNTTPRVFPDGEEMRSLRIDQKAHWKPWVASVLCLGWNGSFNC